MRNRAPASAFRRPGPDEDGLRGMGADSGSDDSDMGFGYPGRLPERRLPELRHARSLVEEEPEEEGGPEGASYSGAGAGDGAGAGGGSASLG